MSDLALGQVLRAAIDQQRHTLQGQIDPRRLERQLGGWVQPEQRMLLPALSLLLRSPLLARSLQENAAGPRREATRAALLQEVANLYSPTVCQRLAAVLQGLLPGEAVTAADHPVAAEPVRPVQEGAAQPPAQAWSPGAPGALPQPTPTSGWSDTAPGSRHGRAAEAVHDAAVRQSNTSAGSGRGLGLLVALLGFLVGGLGAALALLLWLQRNPGAPAAPALNEAALQPAPSAEPAPAPATAAPPAALLPETEPSRMGGGRAAAIASVERLYGALSNRDFDTARSLFGPVAADQFDPAFFEQFSQVSVSDLQEIGSSGTVVELEGRVRFLYPDGSAQVESRSFTVDTASEPALITASAFGRVLQPR